MHITDKLYQTLPLYSNLQTTGVYVYATDIHTKSREAVINAESEIRNEYDTPFNVNYEVSVYDYDDKLVSTFRGEPMVVSPKNNGDGKSFSKNWIIFISGVGDMVISIK